jgi:hypothetical protein
MKIFINKLDFKNIHDKLCKLNNYFIKYESYIEIFSIDGIFKINENNIYKLNPSDSDVIVLKNYYKNFDLIVDKSYYSEELIHSFSPEHIHKNIKKSFFKLSSNSEINLVIEELQSNHSKNQKIDLNINDFYFELNNSIDLNDKLIKNEINEFLLLLI